MIGTGAALMAIGAGISVGCAAIGAGIGVGMTGAAASGVISERPDKFGMAIVFTAVPQTQGIYGLLIAILILQSGGFFGGIPEEIPIPVGLVAIGAGLAAGLAGFSAIGQGIAAASGIANTAENPEIFGKGIVFSAICETQAIYGLLIAILILSLTGVMADENTTAESPPPPANATQTGSGDAVLAAFTGWCTQGNKALEEGRYQAASDAFSAALRLEKDSDTALMGYARALSGLGRDEEAGPVYLRVNATRTGDDQMLIPLVAGLSATGDDEKALEILRNVTARTPEDPRGWDALARAYAGQSRFEEALTAVRRSLEISATRSAGWEGLGTILRGQGRFYEAVAAYEKAIVSDPDNADAWIGLGDTWSSLSRYREAAAAYRNATAVTPDNRMAGERLSEMYLRAGDTREAEEVRTRADQHHGNGTTVNTGPAEKTPETTEEIRPDADTPAEDNSPKEEPEPDHQPLAED